ncbi:MAG TPA: histidine kinase dimerization/phospho-acceptor domain-containing protein, partial [Myxococcaceae bacterium]|nr:histidine kinase dimerization/phospho-acceptor domain-containing protein [Myxococcaceae bacterium]
MPRSVPIELLSFRRTFALLMVLVAVPSAGLTGLGVVAILNERAAVEKRLAALWQDRLETLSSRLRQALEASSVERVDGTVRVTAPSGLRLSGASFRLSRDVLDAADSDLVAALSPVRSQLAFLPERPSFLSLPGPTGPVLIVALRTPEGVLGAELSPEGLQQLVAQTGQDLRSKGEQVRFELTAVHPAGSGLVGKFIGGVPGARNALEVTPLADRPLPAPLQEFQLRAMPEAGDPVAFASLRNRLVYAGLLGAFYATLVVGVVYTARALYLQARLSRLKTDFVSLVSHELRTPLTSIRMFIETLALGRVKDPAQTQEVLEL